MQKPTTRAVLFLLFFLFSGFTGLFGQAANNTCATATPLGVIGGNCSAVAGDLYLANATTNPTGSCSMGNRFDVWYTFTMPAASTIATVSVTITSSPASLTNGGTFIEIFNTSNCTLNGTSVGSCADISAPRSFALTAGATYALRVYVNGTPNVAAGRYNFSLCVTSNDNCATATAITPGTTLNGNVFGASSSGVAAAPCTGNPDDDVWYQFTAPFSYATVTLHNIGSALGSSGERMQVFSGACGALAPLACLGTTDAINLTGLTPGNTYFVRVYSAGTGQAGFTTGNAGFRISVSPSAPVAVTAGRMGEVYHQQILSAPQILADPWEVTYGPDNTLWLTESKGYRVYRIHPQTGVRDTVLDISQGSTFLPPGDQPFNCQFANGAGAQGGCAGLALHPDFMAAVNPKNFVYISYVHTQVSASVFVNRVVRFTFNTGTGRLESPVSLCDTLPGSNDHNSQRMIIAPVGGVPFLFYASGDMGAGQFANVNRVQKAQFPQSYEGKILRFNLEPDGNPGTLDRWIPDTNPFNATLGVQSAVWATGIRNNQGFAFDPALGLLYGSSHGPFSDDEINVLESGRNYGHPLVIGFAEGNVNNTTAGAAPNMIPGHPSSCPVITNEVTNAASLGAAYKDPLFSAYPNSVAFPNIFNLWNTTTGGNAQWPSEGWSGMDLYTHTLVPGWYKSLVSASLKWGRLVRTRLGATGQTTAPANTVNDTISYFGSTNRFRDLAFAPNGKDIYVVMDRNSTTSGPSALNPVVPACAGCVQKYSFLGYADNAGKSSIPLSIQVTTAAPGSCATATTVTIDAANSNYWVPITGPDGNIMAEIFANGQTLGTVTASFYIHGGSNRQAGGVRYLNRNLTITPQFQPVTPVKVRLYFSKTEFDALDADPVSGITGIGDIRILKNADPCSADIQSSTQLIVPQYAETHGPDGYMVQADINGFSSFYFGAFNISLPLQLLTFTGQLQSDGTALLRWKTAQETNTSHFEVERSLDGQQFSPIGRVAAAGESTRELAYDFTDRDASRQGVSLLYYRLRLADRDGAYRYSPVVRIILADWTGRVQVLPNPFRQSVTVVMQSEETGAVNWQLSDAAGKRLARGRVEVQAGSRHSLPLPVEKLPAGTYYLWMEGAGLRQRITLQKL